MKKESRINSFSLNLGLIVLSHGLFMVLISRKFVLN